VNDTRKADLINLVADLGNKEGQGQNAKPAYARACLIAANEGVIGTADATELWSQYFDAMGRTKGDERERYNADTAKVRVSETKQFITVGLTPTVNPVDLFDRAVLVIAEYAPKGSTYQNLVKVMRKQIEQAEALTDQEIIDHLNPEPTTKDEKARLEGILKTMKRTQDGTKGNAETGVPAQPGFPSDELAEAIKQIEARLAAFTRAAEKNHMFELAAKYNAEVVAGKGYVEETVTA